MNTQIEGSFEGWDDGAVFRLTNGQAYQQRHYQYRYHYAYRPLANITVEGGRTFLAVAGMGDPIEVVGVNIIWEGQIVSDFSGFDGSSEFELSNGQVWKQSAYKYAYHYAHRPQAMIIDGMNGVELIVEGMSERTQVRRLR